MNLRWLWFDHIPPELEVPKEARRRVQLRIDVAYWDPTNYRGRRNIAILTFLAFPLAISLAWFVMWFLPFAPWVRAVVVIALVLVVLTPPVMGAHLLSARCWRLAMCHLGYLCCVKCGYVHTGLSKDVKECPECGAAREFGKCIHCNSPQEWAMTPQDTCTQCGRLRLS